MDIKSINSVYTFFFVYTAVPCYRITAADGGIRYYIHYLWPAGQLKIELTLAVAYLISRRILDQLTSTSIFLAYLCPCVCLTIAQSIADERIWQLRQYSQLQRENTIATLSSWFVNKNRLLGGICLTVTFFPCIALTGADSHFRCIHWDSRKDNEFVNRHTITAMDSLTRRFFKHLVCDQLLAIYYRTIANCIVDYRSIRTPYFQIQYMIYTIATNS